MDRIRLGRPPVTNHQLAFHAAVFDCDGTLVETGSLWRRAYRRATGEEIPDELIERLGLSGASTDQAAERLGAHFGRRVDPDVIEAGLMEAAGGEALAPMEGVEELLRFLSARGLPLAIATNGPLDFVKTVLGEHLLQFFKFVQPSESLNPKRHKPEPDVYAAACEGLHVAANQSLAFEDAEVGARSARAAGLALVYVNEKRDPPPGLATIHVRSLSDRRLYDFLEIGLTP